MENKMKYRLKGVLLLVGLSLWSCGGKKAVVRKTPKSQIVYRDQDLAICDGYSTTAKPWIVYSVQDGLPVYASSVETTTDKKIGFFESFVVLKRKGGRLKVAKYAAESLEDFKMNKALAKPFGWVKESDLLLWTASLRNASTGFRLKGYLGIQDAHIIAHSEKYLSKDSLLVYRDPSLLHLSESKLPLNTIVYLYKFSADRKKVLIGGQPRIEVDNPKTQLYGWIDTRLLAVWGERTALRIKPTPGENAIQIGLEDHHLQSDTFTPIISSSSLSDVRDLQHIFPLHYHRETDRFDVHYLDHQLDFSENYVYNVEGKPIYHPVFREMLKDNRQLNLIFVLDGSREISGHRLLLKSIFQGWNPPAYFVKTTYSALYYNTSPEEKIQQDKRMVDFDTWANSFSTISSTTPVSPQRIHLKDGVLSLTELLQSREDQSNLVVILGQDLQPVDLAQKQELIDLLADTHSRLMFYQVRANTSDRYNDFVLFAETAIKTLADQLLPYKKQRLLPQEAVVEENEFDLTQGDQGIYVLDYPKQSMHQGAVLFPKKGGENKPLILKRTLDQVLGDMALANQKTDSVLTAVFQSPVGVSHTKIKPIYDAWYKQDQLYVSPNIAKQLANQAYTFLHKGVLKKADEKTYEHLEYGVLLDEEEVEQLRDYYLNVYTEVFKKQHLSNRKMIKNYVRVGRNKQGKQVKIPSSFVKNNPFYISLFQQTGLYLTDRDSLSNLPLKRWKKKKNINPKLLMHFFRSFKTKADELSEHKVNVKVNLPQQQTNFYWFNQAFIPVLDYNKQNQKGKTSDLLPLEIEQESKRERKKNEEYTREYMERVKRGMP